MSLRARIRKLERRPRRVRLDTELLADVVRFNEVAGSRPLRPYQAEVARAVVESIEAGRGDVLTVMMARQMGKNQLSAALEHYLLHRCADAGGQIVKCAPTFKPQVINSKQRLERELAGPYSRGRWRGEYGYAIRLGGARVLLFSAEPGANVVGATADLLLEIDEAQNVDEDKYLRDFRPMASTTNATTVLYGTAWSEDCLLEKARQESLGRQRRSGRRLHFEYPWDHLAALNPAYGRFVEGEIARLGESHPVIRTQYLLQAVPALGRFLSLQQRALLRGRDRRRRRSRGSGRRRVARPGTAARLHRGHDRPRLVGCRARAVPGGGGALLLDRTRPPQPVHRRAARGARRVGLPSRGRGCDGHRRRAGQLAAARAQRGRGRAVRVHGAEQEPAGLPASWHDQHGPLHGLRTRRLGRRAGTMARGRAGPLRDAGESGRQMGGARHRGSRRLSRLAGAVLPR